MLTATLTLPIDLSAQFVQSTKRFETITVKDISLERIRFEYNPQHLPGLSLLDVLSSIGLYHCVQFAELQTIEALERSPQPPMPRRTSASIDTIQAKIDELVEWRRLLRCRGQRDAFQRVTDKLRLARRDLQTAKLDAAKA